MTTAIEQGAKLIGMEVSIGKRVGKIEAVRKGLPLTDLSTLVVDEDTVQFCLRQTNGKTWWSGSYPKQDQKENHH
ncbi:hypothetical protein [Chromobacterium haemolyticum]|uniref:hypothetical protein n=1 Tax=Chromobacterium haemolyticum TaxID=394935 RepID=UPI00244984C3|nr:hypothetical protein [Chromobacterium haemolyticum]MDH0342023.1 hypothetical protein [Chromobacterium haemolyticum]